MKTAITIALLLMSSLCLAADYVAEVVTPREVVGIGRQPTIIRAYSANCGDNYSLEDVTGQKHIAEPNFMVAKIVCDNATIAKMKDDGYLILWSQRVPDKGEIGQSAEPVKPLPKQTVAELDKLKYDLEYIGIPTAATALADTAKADVTAADVANQVKDVARGFPKSTKVEEAKPK